MSSPSVPQENRLYPRRSPKGKIKGKKDIQCSKMKKKIHIEMKPEIKDICRGFCVLEIRLAAPIIGRLSRTPQESPGRTSDRLCEPCDVVADWTRRKSDARSPQLRMHTLKSCIRAIPTSFGPKKKKPDSRFSPVWLYIWVWRELGRVNRLSQTLHLCFFCVLGAALELNCPIMDCGAGGATGPSSADGLGKVREGSISD